jgi:protein CpxP
MKNQLKLTSLILTAALAALPALQAQSPEKPAPAQERGPGGPGGGARPNLDRLAEELGLTADQKAKLGPIMKHQQEQMQALRKDESLSQEQRREKSRALREENQKAIAAILTPEQAKKFADMRERGPRGGGEHPAKGEKKGDK